MVKTYVPDQLLAKWFIESVLPSITEEVAKGGVVTEEKVIALAQYLDLIYTKSGTLYEKIIDAPRQEFSVPPPPKSNKDSHAGDGMIDTSITQTAKAPSGKALAVSSKKENDKPLALEINAMSSNKGKNPKQPRGKKKGKSNKKKQKISPPEKPSKKPTGHQKPRYPCLICNDDHFMKYCPHRAEVAKFLKTSSTSTILTDPFMNLETNLVAVDHASPSQVLMLSISK